MNEKLYLKNGQLKVLTVDGTHPMYSDHCCCQEPILTGKWFADFVQYNMASQINLTIYDSDNIDYIFQTDEYNLCSGDPSWTPSATVYPQSRFYDSFVYWDVAGMQALRYKTRQLTQTEDGFLLTVPLTKENRWWNNCGSDSIVSGNSTSGVYDCYNLSTCVTTLELERNQGSGFISSLILNNCDNNFAVDDFILENSFKKYAISAESYYPVLTTGYQRSSIEYIPITEPVSASVQYYLSRIYKGDQEAYIYNIQHPTIYTTQDGYYSIYRNLILAGSDNVPVPGKNYYIFLQDGDWASLRKEGNKYYGYSLGDRKTIIQYAQNVVQSTVVKYDDGSQGILKITTGLQVYDSNDVQWPLLSSSDGLMLQESNGELYPISQFSEQYMGEQWSNYQYTVGGNTYYTTKIYGQSGQYYVDYPYAYQTIDDIDYYWWYYVCFPKEYDSVTNIATMNVYKFGQDITNDIFCSGFVTSTAFLSAVADPWPPEEWYPEDQEEEQPAYPTIKWSDDLSCFYYNQGGGEYNHPDYLNMSFVLTTGLDLNNQPISTTFYVYKAPAWGVLLGGKKQASFDSRYAVTGSTYDNLVCLSCVQGVPKYEVTTSAGWYIGHGDPNNLFYLPCLSGENYWYVPSGIMVNNELSTIQLPLTGGDVRNPQKSVAADDPNRPPYWYFHAGDEIGLEYQNRDYDYHDEIASGRYIAIPKDATNWYYSIGVLAPIYYDTYYGNVINHYSNIYLTDSNGVLDQYYLQAKEMINEHSYEFACPFIKYVETQYNYDSGENPPTVQNFISPTYYRDWDPIQTTDTIYLFDEMNTQDAKAQWGGGHPNDGENYYYRTRTQKFVKMTEAEINDPFIVPTNRDYAIDKNLSAVLPFIDGLYCQILTGFWIQSRHDYYDGPGSDVCGIRKYGYTRQLLSFDTEYKFGYDLTNVADLDALLSADDSVCFTLNSSNKVVSTTVADYWNNKIKAHLQPTTPLGQLNYNDFYSASQIRVISAHYNIPVQP